MHLAYLPSPSQGVWHLGPVPIRGYALCIILGIAAAVWIGERRWVARGGQSGTVMDVAVWAVIFGLIGGRLYHILSDPELYFGAGRHPIDVVKIWRGGLGIWGAISLGGVGAWIGCRRAGIKLPPFADAVAPGIAVAQAIGRWGNYVNQELFGRPTTLPWGVQIDPGREGTVVGVEAYHPTFLYESLWCLGVAGLVVWADRRFRLGHGRAFAVYVMAYTAGRVWIEALRIDHANHVLGLRLNIWVSILVFIGALAYFLAHGGPRETDVQPVPRLADDGAEPAAGSQDGTGPQDGTGSAAAERAGAEDAGAEDAGAEPAAGQDHGDAAAGATEMEVAEPGVTEPEAAAAAVGVGDTGDAAAGVSDDRVADAQTADARPADAGVKSDRRAADVPSDRDA